jgi:YHS domain-containing protein
MAVCPVCGTEAEEKKARSTRTVKGGTGYFYSRASKKDLMAI